MIIDATIPPLTDAKAHAMFERIRPPNPISGSRIMRRPKLLDLVRALPPRFFGLTLLGRR